MSIEPNRSTDPSSTGTETTEPSTSCVGSFWWPEHVATPPRQACAHARSMCVLCRSRSSAFDRIV
eukprot:13899215-Alexandrium_andersonii.AAC.1